MSFHRPFFALVMVAALFAFMSLGEGAEQAQAPGFADAPGKELLMSRCFQCHGEKMWQDLRQDRRGWEAALYRMVGRGALWTEEEINTMASYLSTAFGPQAAKTAK